MSVQHTLWRMNMQSFESLNDESLNTSDLSSDSKRNGNGVSETVRAMKARRWPDAEVDRSRAIFWANQCGAGLFPKDSG